MKCIICNQYFKQHHFNRTNECDNCSAVILDIDQETELDLEILKNPTGKTQPVFYEDRDDPEMDVRDSI
jgi:hypothetical protein